MNRTEVFIVVAAVITLCLCVLGWQAFRIWNAYRERLYQERMEDRIQEANKGERHGG